MSRRERTQQINLSKDQAETLDLQLFDIIRAWHLSLDADLKSLARSCYLQGLVDGSNPGITEALNTMKNHPAITQ